MAVGRFRVETIATLTASDTEVDNFGIADTPVRVLGFEVHNPSADEDLLFKVNDGNYITVPAVATPPSVYASPMLGAGDVYKLGGTLNEVEWKAGANTISSPMFVWILAE